MIPATVPVLESSHDPSTKRPALMNRAQEINGRSGRDDSRCRNANPKEAKTALFRFTAFYFVLLPGEVHSRSDGEPGFCARERRNEFDSRESNFFGQMDGKRGAGAADCGRSAAGAEPGDQVQRGSQCGKADDAAAEGLRAPPDGAPSGA